MSSDRRAPVGRLRVKCQATSCAACAPTRALARVRSAGSSLGAHMGCLSCAPWQTLLYLGLMGKKKKHFRDITFVHGDPSSVPTTTEDPIHPKKKKNQEDSIHYVLDRI